MRSGLDSNVLVYAELEPGSPKGKLARQLIVWISHDGVLSPQVLQDFVAVVRRVRPESLESALRKVETWRQVFYTSPTDEHVLSAAMTLVRDHGLQVWDAVIWAATSQAGARILFTEDMQDGRALLGVRAVNPFSRTSEGLETLLRG